MHVNTLRATLFASALSVITMPAMAQQTTVAPGTVQAIPPNAIFVNPTGQDTFVTGGSQQSVNQAPTAQGGAGGLGGQGGRGGRATVTNNNTVSLPTGYGAGAGGAGGYPSTIRNTPSVSLAVATAYCQNNAGFFGSGPGFSGGVTVGKHDIDCKRLNYALLLGSFGMIQEALLVIANNPEVNAAIWEAHRQREAIAASQPVVPQQPVGMNRATARDPRPSARQCETLRNLADPTQVQRDYLVANCS